jgi:hypothetical protein
MDVDPRLQTPLILGGFGLVFTLVGLWMLWSAWRERADPVEAAPLVDARTLEAQQPGTLVLAEGRVAEGTRAGEGGLVLSQRQVATGVTKPGSNDVRFTWEPASSALPAFDLALPGGVVRVRSGEATLSDPPRVVPEDPGVVTAGVERHVGFAAGDEFTVRAIVVRDGQRAELQPQELFGGSAEAYRAEARRRRLVPFIFGGAFALVGVALLLTALAQAGRVWRS